jgi:hypothetical protein
MSYGIILGEINHTVRTFSKFKKGDQNYHKFKNERLMLGTVTKIRNITPVLIIYFLSMNIRDKNPTFK